MRLMGRYNIGTDVAFGTRLLITGALVRDLAVFVGGMLAATLWSARSVIAFVRASLRLPAPPSDHTLTFAAWAAEHRSWLGVVAALGCLNVRDARMVAPIRHSNSRFCARR